MKRMKGVGFVLLVLSLWYVGGFLFGTCFAAPADFPKKEVTIIVSFGPGGGRDILSRGVGKTMSKYLGVPVVVMNMPGAGGARGLIHLYNSAPDGYTIGIGSINDILDQILEKREYDNRKFSYIGRAESSPGFLFVKSDSPFRTIKDFKTFGKPLRQSTFSLMGNSCVAFMILANRENFPMVIVAGYKSAAEALIGMIRGEVEFSGCGQVAAMPFIQAKQIRPMLTLHAKRSPDFPDIASVAEIGYPDLANFAQDYWFMGPPNVPKDRLQVLEDALTKTLHDEEFLAFAKGAGVKPGPLKGEEMQKTVLKMFGFFEQYRADIEKHIKK